MAQVKSTKDNPDRIETEMIYSRHTSYRQVIRPPTAKSEAKVKTSPVPIKQTVTNGRNMGIQLTTHGFQLIKQQTKLSTNDFYNNEKKIKEIYYKELCQRVKEFTGAEHVIAFHHQIRNGNGTTTTEAKTEQKSNLSKVTIQRPAHEIHNDYTIELANDTYAYHKPKDSKYLTGRYAIINAWRNISDIPIQRDHLAVL